MHHFKILFSNPWLLFLLIPAVVLTLFPYFRLNKRYRRTRNRITSIVLHLLVMTLCITVLAGISFSYDIVNTENEVILLVDVSDSGSDAEEARNDFIRSVLDESREEFKVGIVTFGYTQVYASPLSVDTDRAYDNYLAAELPDDTATDIASALEYTAELFENPATAKIVLITDGAETDRKARDVIKKIAAEGIRVDSVFFPTEHESEVQLIDITVPDYNVAIGDPFTLGLTVQSNFEGQAYITLYDNSEAQAAQAVNFTKGVQTFEVTHTFSTPDMHELHFEIRSEDDVLTQNNAYYSYIYLQVFDRILVLERYDNESDRLLEVMDESYTVDVVNITDTDKVPAELDDLRMYDQVILMNIANADMPIGFDEILYSYVNEIGGGLFTIGGSKHTPGGDVETDIDGNPVPNTYVRDDMYGTIYQQMLPVQAVNYTPPIAVVFIIDRSGSMTIPDASGRTKLDVAKEGAATCVEHVLSERDWCGVMTLEDTYNEEIQLTPMPRKRDILAAIDDIEEGGGTVYTSAIDRAGAALNALTGVERRHIVLVTDAEPSDELFEDANLETGGYGGMIRHYYDTAKITTSIISIGGTESELVDMERAAELGHGRCYDIYDVQRVPDIMAEELRLPEIKSINYEPFQPTISDHTPVVSNIDPRDMPQLMGYFGTKAKDGAEVSLMGEYVPIYAQWKFGAGTVGSFMCDLSGYWSDEFLRSPVGAVFIGNVIKGLFPTEDIRPKDIEAGFTEENYRTQISIFTSMEEGESIRVSVKPISDGTAEPDVYLPSAAEGYSRVTITVRDPGIHEVLIQKMKGDEVVSSYTAYKKFSYSKEYDVFIDADDCLTFLEALSKEGDGEVISDAEAVFGDFVRYIPKSYDPILPFMIAAVVLFLLDIAVRKFKFKWSHELVRDYKAKKELKRSEN